MNRHFILAGILLCLIGITYASTDPMITSVDYNQPYINQQTTFTVHIDSGQTNGNIRFVDNGYLITQKQFTQSTTDISFTYTWNVSEVRNIKFYLADINDSTNDILTNNDWNKDITIKRGLDLTVSSFMMSPTTITPNTLMNFNVTVKNIGDENYDGNIPVVVLIDANNSCAGVVTNIGALGLANDTRQMICSWTSPSMPDQNYNIVAIVNRNGLIPEFTTINNSLYLNMPGTQAADLIIDSISVTSPIRRGLIENIGVVVKNVGGSYVPTTTVNLYLTHLGTKSLIYSQPINDIYSTNARSFNYIYQFNDIGDYTITAYVDENQSALESNYSNNQFSKQISVLDYNFDSIVAENDTFRNQIAVMTSTITTLQSDNSSLRESVQTCQVKYQSTLDNLEVCNTNNSTKIANWMTSLDANKDAELHILQNENDQLRSDNLAEANKHVTELEAVQNEKSQWIILFISCLVAYVGYLVYQQYLKNRPRKSVGTGSGL